MPAKDRFHDAVKNAVTKEGWKITHDTLYIRFGEVELFIDLGAEKIIAAEKDGEKIAIEVKSFLSASTISAFHQAVGQFLNYRLALEEQEPELTLYLAVPTDAYDKFFTLKLPQMAIQRYQISLIVYEPEKEEIRAWIK